MKKSRNLLSLAKIVESLTLNSKLLPAAAVTYTIKTTGEGLNVIGVGHLQAQSVY